MHYKEFIEAIELGLSRMPPDVLQRIVKKPSSYDRGSDLAWRKLCREWGIDTSPRGESADNTAYAARRRMAEQVESMRAELSQVRDELAHYKTRDALRRVIDQEGRPRE